MTDNASLDLRPDVTGHAHGEGKVQVHPPGGLDRLCNTMPSWELFRKQAPSYRHEVLPPGLPRVAVEAASPIGRRQWADASVTLDHFGASAPADVLFREVRLHRRGRGSEGAGAAAMKEET